MVRARGFSLLVAVVALPALVRGSDLADLERRYRAALAALRTADEPAVAVERRVAPVLRAIGALGTPEALALLQRELESAPPLVAAACVPPLVLSARESVIAALLARYPRCPLEVRERIISSLAQGTIDLAPFAAVIERIVAAELDADVRRHLPYLFRRLESVELARLLVERTPEATSARAPRSQSEFDAIDALIEALAGTTSPAVRGWLEGSALEEARGRPARLEVLAAVAGRLGLESWRPALEGLAAHASPWTAAAAITALQTLGADASIDALIAALSEGPGRGDPVVRTFALEAIASVGTSETGGAEGTDSTEGVIGTAGERAMTVLESAARSKDEALRAITLQSLARRDGERTTALLVGGLRDPSPHVRAAALAALDGRKDAGVVEALFDTLEKDPERRFRFDAQAILAALTGQDFGMVAADWRKWWLTASATFDPANPLPEGERISPTAVRPRRVEEPPAEYFGLEVTRSTKISFLVDISGSMQGDKIATLQRELSGVLAKLPQTTFVNIVAFNSGFRAWKPDLQPLLSARRADAIRFVRGLKPKALTNVFDTLEFALGDERVDTVYLLSDGAPTTGRLTSPSAILRTVRVLNRDRGVTIHCIAFGLDSAFLRRLAEEHRGEYRFVRP